MKRHNSDQLSRRAIWRSLSGVAVSTAMLLSVGQLARADGEVTSVTVRSDTPTPSQYTLNGTTYTWGIGGNLVLESFEYAGDTYDYMVNADTVRLRRVDNPLSSGEPCGVFAENTGVYNELVPNYPARVDGSDNCDMAAMLGGRVMNRGALNVFSNTGPDPKNVERVDYLFPNGIVAPLSAPALAQSGHVVAEKRGNNPIQVAAVTALDANGDPSAYGPLLLIEPAGCASGQLCYGVTQIQHSYSFLQNASTGEQGYVDYRGGATEHLAMAFVSNERLGLSIGQRYFGFSFFAPDVDASVHDLTDPTSFPQDSADNNIVIGDGADFYGGVSGWFLADGLQNDGGGSLLSGSVFVDLNNNGVLDTNEAALDGVSVSLVADTNGNGVYDAGVDEVLTATETGVDGGYYFAGVPSGRYFVLLDSDDTDIPPALQLPNGSNPVTVDVIGEDQSGVNFGFTLPSSDGTQPVAVADTVASPQDQPITIDVLANDIDPIGGGLTLVSVGNAQNGTAVISGDQVVYTPDFGFIGSDSFVYVVEDSVGQQATGSVAVEMLQFSDINNNGIDDYVECACTDIRLITGVDGIGVGSAGFGVLALSLAAVFRRRPRQVSRLIPALLPAGALVALSLVGAAVADVSPDDREFDERWYVGGGLGGTRLEPEPQSTSMTVYDNSSNSFNIFVGRDLSPRYSVEGYVSNLGGAGIDFLGTPVGDVDYTVAGGSVIGYLHNARGANADDEFDDEGLWRREGFSLYGRVGLGVMSNSSALQYDTRNNVHIAGGLGAEYGWDNGVAVRLEATAYDTDARELSVRLLKRFGEANAYPAAATLAALPVVVDVAPEPTPRPAPSPAEPPIATLPSGLFGFDQSRISPAFADELIGLVRILNDNPGLRIVVEGHTDSLGTDAYNLALSERRAEAVVSFLFDRGVNASQIDIRGFGEARPVADNANAAGRALNRRVEIVKQ